MERMESPPPPKTQSLTRKLHVLAEGGHTSHQGTAARSMSREATEPGDVASGTYLGRHRAGCSWLAAKMYLL